MKGLDQLAFESVKLHSWRFHLKISRVYQVVADCSKSKLCLCSSHQQHKFTSDFFQIGLVHQNFQWAETAQSPQVDHVDITRKATKHQEVNSSLGWYTQPTRRPFRVGWALDWSRRARVCGCTMTSPSRKFLCKNTRLSTLRSHISLYRDSAGNPNC